MEKKMIILAIIGLTGLILGASGLGLGIFNSLSETPPPTLHSTYNIDSVYTNPIDTSQTIPKCNLTFSVTLGDAVYFTYSGIASVYSNGTRSSIHLWFFIDGVIYNEGYAYLGSNTTDSFIAVSITLNAAVPYLSTGSHNVTIKFQGNCVNNSLSHHFLCVQVYPA